jgi:hypothetical protein
VYTDAASTTAAAGGPEAGSDREAPGPSSAGHFRVRGEAMLAVPRVLGIEGVGVVDASPAR